MKKLNLLSRAEMKKVMGGITPEGCIIYSITQDASGNTIRTFMGEYMNAQEANNAAASAVVDGGGRYGYDCPDGNGAYEHPYIW